MLSACKKDVDELLWDEAVEFGLNGVFQRMQDGPESYVVDPSGPIEVLANHDVWVRIPENSILDDAGNVVTGDVDLEVIVILTKADMVKYRAPTMTSDKKFLESGGEVFIQAYKNGTPLVFDSSKSFSVQIPDNNPQSDMDYFIGERDASGNVVWDLGSDDLSSWSNPTPSEWGPGMSNNEEDWGYGYELLCDRFGWQNIDKFLDNFGEPVSDNRVSVSLPAGFGNNNTGGYCILDDYQSVIGMFVDDVNEQFYIEGIPVGSNITIFLASLQEVNGVETSYAEIISVVVEANHLIEVSTMTERTASEIALLLDAI